jgi:putative nucleotidyltransferase with HDIG domain
MMLYRSKHLPFTEGSRQKLLENNVRMLFVPTSEKREYQEYIEQNLGTIIRDPAIREEKKAEIIYDSSKALVKDVLANPTLGENMQRSKNMVANQVAYILKGRDAFLNLMKITSFDYYTYTHSVNVCTFAIALANQLGISDDGTLNALGAGALLHDVGKSRVSDRILNKRAGLNRSEFEIVKRHPNWGIEIVSGSEYVAEESYFPIIQHHERMDGSGYPMGLSGDSIHLFGKITAICDVFDALTTQRVYQDALASYPAFQIMYNIRHEFDEKILKEFTKLMGPNEAITNI